LTNKEKCGILCTKYQRVSHKMNQALNSNLIVSIIILVLVELLIIKELMVVGRETG
jgi:hypothetical protein